MAVGRKARREELMARALEMVEGAERPVSVDYIAYRLGVGWQTARALLLELALRGRVKMLDTTKSYVFWVERPVEGAVEAEA